MEKEIKYTASVECKNITKEDINDVLKNNVVKVIFLNEKYSDISSDDTVHEIHKFKSKYPGNTYIKLPVKVVEKKDKRYIEVDNTENPEGFAIISKHDMRDLFKHLRKANKAERTDYGKTLCLKHIVLLNKMLNNELYTLTIKDSDGNVVSNEEIWGDFDDINDFIEDRINGLKRPTGALYSNE